MKKSSFFYVAGAAIGTAAIAAVAKKVTENGDAKQTFGKARDGAVAMFGQAKQAVTGVFTAVRDRVTGNDNDFTGGDARDLAVSRPAAEAPKTEPLMLAGASAAQPEPATDEQVKDAA